MPPVAPKPPVKPQVKPLAARKQFSTEFIYFLIENAFGYQGIHIIKIDNAGLVRVIGKNLQSKEESSSGAGKTRMWTLLMYLIFGKQALGSNETIKDADVFGKDFRIETMFKRHGKTLLVRETRNHSNAKFDKGLHIYEVGASNVVTPWEAGPKNDPLLLRKKLQKFLSWTYKEAVGTVIWPQNFGHALVEGKPTERISFLSDLYGLTRYDEVFAELDIKHKDVKSRIAELLEFKTEYRFVEEAIQKAGNIRVVAENAKTLQVQIADFLKRHNANQIKLNNVKQRIDRFHELAEQLESFKKHELDPNETHLLADGQLLETFDASNDKVKDCLVKYEDAVRGIDRLHDCQDRLEALGIVEADTDALRLEESRILEILQSTRRPKYSEQELSHLTKGRDAWKQKIIQLARDSRIKPDLEHAKQTLQQTIEIVAQLTATMQLLDEQRNSFNQLTSKLVKKDGQCRCPTCKQVVDDSNLNEMDKQLGDRLAKLDSELVPHEERESQLTSLVDALEKWRKLADEIKEASLDLDNAKKIHTSNKRLQEIRLTLSQQDEFKDVTAEYSEFNRKYGKLNYEKMKKGVEHFDKLVSDNQERRNIYYAAVQDSSAVQVSARALSIDDPFTLDIADTLKDLEQQHQRLAVWLEAADEKINKGRQKLEQYRQIVRDFKEKKNHLDALRIQMEELKCLEEQEMVIANTKPAYAKNGMKLEKLKQLLKDLADRLPYWTRVLFTEKDFQVKVREDDSCTGLALVVQKTFEFGKRKITHDVDISSLSGGERSRMAVCLMLTMSELVSYEKRTNFLVLDEVDRHMDTYAQRLMAELLIPLMRKRKSGLFVISHSTLIDPKKFDQTMVVTKHPNNSTEIKVVDHRRSERTRQ